MQSKLAYSIEAQIAKHKSLKLAAVRRLPASRRVLQAAMGCGKIKALCRSVNLPSVDVEPLSVVRRIALCMERYLACPRCFAVPPLLPRPAPLTHQQCQR